MVAFSLSAHLLISFLLISTCSLLFIPLSLFLLLSSCSHYICDSDTEIIFFHFYFWALPSFHWRCTWGAMNGKVIGSGLKWNRLFRLRCVLPCNVQWMRKYCKAESSGEVVFRLGGGEQVVSLWGAAAARLRATLWNINSDSTVICATLSIWAWNPLFTVTFRALLSQPLNVEN